MALSPIAFRSSSVLRRRLFDVIHNENVGWASLHFELKAKLVQRLIVRRAEVCSPAPGYRNRVIRISHEVLNGKVVSPGKAGFILDGRCDLEAYFLYQLPHVSANKFDPARHRYRSAAPSSLEIRKFGPDFPTDNT